MHDLSELPDMPELNDTTLDLFDSYISHKCALEPEKGTTPDYISNEDEYPLDTCLRLISGT